MKPIGHLPFFFPRLFSRALGYWNWKCALLSASARSLVYLAAMARSGPNGRVAVVLVEMGYVLFTAGLYAGLQQKALGLRSRLLANLTVVLAVPMLAQLLDWLAHRAVGAVAPPKATLAVCIFAAISACFHLHVMRRGAFITGSRGHSLLADFQRIPRLTAGFVLLPLTWLSAIASRLARGVESQAAL
jgi:hypothetical protein